MSRRILFFVCLVSLFSIAESGKKKGKNNGKKKKAAESDSENTAERDVLSFSDLTQYQTTSLKVKVVVNMTAPEFGLSGEVEIHYSKLKEDEKPLILDTLGLEILMVRQLTGKDIFKKVPFRLGEHVTDMGSALRIYVKTSVQSGVVKVAYTARSPYTSLHFLGPGYSGYHNYSFLYSLSQPALARSWIPCQDTASVKVPVEMEAVVPKPYTALMSGLLVSERDDELYPSNSVFVFHQPLPVSPYHLSITVGILENITISDRIVIWGEPSEIDEISSSFGLTEELLQLCEDMLGPYVWGRYDFVVLPLMMGYWGMEHTNMNFIASSIMPRHQSAYLDNSLMLELFSHEVIHSWFGNLITSSYSTHSNIWLNEGITTYISYYITGDFLEDPEVTNLYFTRARRNLELNQRNLPWKSLENTIGTMSMMGVFSSVPYLKGALFMKHLENAVGGRDKISAFLRVCLVMFAYQNINTEDFRSVFEVVFPNVTDVEWERWLYEDSLNMIGEVELEESLYYTNCQEVITAWTSGKGNNYKASQLKHMNTIEIAFMFEELLMSDEYNLTLLDSKKVTKLLKTLDMYQDKEIFSRWSTVALMLGDKRIIPDVLEFVEENGREELILGIYQQLAHLGGEARVSAREVVERVDYKWEIENEIREILEMDEITLDFK